MITHPKKPLSEYDLTSEKTEQILARIDLVELLLDETLDDGHSPLSILLH